MTGLPRYGRRYLQALDLNVAASGPQTPAEENALLRLQLDDTRSHIALLQQQLADARDAAHDLAQQILALRRENKRLREDVDIADHRMNRVLRGGPL